MIKGWGFALFLFVLSCSSAHAELLASLEEGIRQIFPGAVISGQSRLCLPAAVAGRIAEAADVPLEEGRSIKIVRLTVSKDGKAIGQVVEDAAEGRWGPIRYLVGVDLDGAVAGVVVLEHQEARGGGISKSRFLKQYRGKTTKDRLRLRKDVDAVTSATVSSRALTDGVRKNLYILKELADPQSSELCD